MNHRGLSEKISRRNALVGSHDVKSGYPSLLTVQYLQYAVAYSLSDRTLPISDLHVIRIMFRA